MAPPSPQPDDTPPRDAAYWAALVSTLRVSDVPQGAINLNVEGRRVVGPLQGFGPLWRKTYRVRLTGTQITPAEVVRTWKADFATFHPPQNRFYAGKAGVAPGQIMFLNASMQGIPVDTGLMVLYADDESFTLITPEGCPEAGWITCSAEMEGAAAAAQVQTFGRANDPIYEIGFRLAGARQQEKIWTHVLRSLAAQFGVSDEPVQVSKTCLDPRYQWSGARNVWQNAGIRSILYKMAAPVRVPARLIRRRARQ